MKCCNNETNDENKQEHKNKSHMSHMWMMALCCGAPLLILLFLSVVGNFIPNIRNALIGIVPYLCPILMLLMIPMMLGKCGESKENKNHCEKKEDM